MTRKPDIILFDVDDTFYTTEGPHHCAIGVSLKRFSSLTRTPIGRCRQLYLQSRDSVKLFLGHTASSHSRLLYFQRMLENCEYESAKLDKSAISLELEELYWSTFLQEIPRDPRIEDLMITIKALGIRIGIVTDLTADPDAKVNAPRNIISN
jgi:FMN phosphatase YigB (HAD superfamily)